MTPNTPRCSVIDFAVDRSVGHLWTEYAALIPVTHTLDDVLAATYFGALKSQRPKERRRPNDPGLWPGDYISVKAIDNSWQARLVVRDVPEGLDQVIVEMIPGTLVEFDAKDIPSGYEIQFRGPQAGHIIMLNGQEIERGFATPETARNRIEFFERTNKASARVATAKTKRPVKRTTAKADTEQETA